MDQKEYEKCRNELEVLLQERGVIVYDSEADKFLEGIFPVTIDMSEFEDDMKQVLIIQAASMMGELGLGEARWTDDHAKADVIENLFAFYYVLNSLLWTRNGVFNHFKFVFKDTTDFESIITNARDGDFIDKFLGDFE